MGTDELSISDLAARQPGKECDEPYRHVDSASLPNWWETIAEKFERYGLRPYRPPKLRDGTILPALVPQLEVKHGVNIRILKFDSAGDQWRIYVDDDYIASMKGKRVPEGYTQFEITAEEFVDRLREHEQP